MPWSYVSWIPMNWKWCACILIAVPHRSSLRAIQSLSSYLQWFWNLIKYKLHALCSSPLHSPPWVSLLSDHHMALQRNIQRSSFSNPTRTPNRISIQRTSRKLLNLIIFYLDFPVTNFLINVLNILFIILNKIWCMPTSTNHLILQNLSTLSIRIFQWW